jgi:hypothetical protein
LSHREPTPSATGGFGFGTAASGRAIGLGLRPLKVTAEAVSLDPETSQTDALWPTVGFSASFGNSAYDNLV